MAYLLCRAEVIRAPNVVMHERFEWLSNFAVHASVKATFEDRLHLLVGTGLELQRTCAGGLKPLLSVSISEPDQAETRTITLLRMPA
jgi:hypothetical protein